LLLKTFCAPNNQRASPPFSFLLGIPENVRTVRSCSVWRPFLFHVFFFFLKAVGILFFPPPSLFSRLGAETTRMTFPSLSDPLSSKIEGHRASLSFWGEPRRRVFWTEIPSSFVRKFERFSSARVDGGREYPEMPASSLLPPPGDFRTRFFFLSSARAAPRFLMPGVSFFSFLAARRGQPFLFSFFFPSFVESNWHSSRLWTALPFFFFFAFVWVWRYRAGPGVAPRLSPL